MKSEDAGKILWVGEKREFVAEVELTIRLKFPRNSLKIAMPVKQGKR